MLGQGRPTRLRADFRGWQRCASAPASARDAGLRAIGRALFAVLVPGAYPLAALPGVAHADDTPPPVPAK